MDLEYLKKTWEKLPSEKQLDEDQLMKMIGHRTKSLIETIDRNIKIGFGILFVFIVLFALGDLILSPALMNEFDENLDIPGWVLFISMFSNFLIIITFIYFAIKYYRVKKSCDMNCNLKETLVKIINTLKIYRTIFNLALVTILFVIGTEIVTGIFRGSLEGMQGKDMVLSDIQANKIVLVILIAFVLLVFLFGLFLFLRWGFRKLYGNYIHELKLTLKELEEINE